jgi:hypothetical protein
MTFLRITAIVAIAIGSAIATSGVRNPRSLDDGGLKQKNPFEKCPADSDPRYRRQQIMGQLAGILNQSIPKNAIYFPLLHADREGNRLRFFVYDLTDPGNIHPEEQKRGPNLDASCIRFAENHVYHFAPFYIPFSFSHIAFLQNGEVKVFRLLNCEGKGDSSDDVVAYLKQKLPDNKETEQVISRVRDYRKFGDYFTIDDTSLRCGQINAPPKQ